MLLKLFSLCFFALLTSSAFASLYMPSVGKDQCNSQERAYELSPVFPDNPYGSNNLIFARSALIKSINNALEMARRAIDYLHIPGPIRKVLDLTITKIVFTLSDILVEDFSFRGGVDIKYPQTPKDDVWLAIKDVNIDIIMNYKANMSMPNIEVAGQISVSALFDFSSMLDVIVQDSTGDCPYRIKIGDRTNPIVYFTRMTIEISGSEILSAFARLITSFLKDLLNELLSDLLKDLLVTNVNKHMNWLKDTAAMKISSFPALAGVDIRYDRRFTDLRWEPQNLVLVQGGYIVNQSRMDITYIPSKISMLPEKIVIFDDMSYIFGIETFNSVLETFIVYKLYDFSLNAKTVVEFEETAEGYSFPDIYRDALFATTKEKGGMLPTIFPDLEKLIGTDSIAIDFITDSIVFPKIGPAGLLTSHDFTIIIKNARTGEKLLAYRTNEGSLVTTIKLRLIDYVENDQPMQYGQFWFAFVVYSTPKEIEIIENPSGLEFNKEAIDKLKVYSMYAQQMAIGKMRKDSYDGLCLQLENLMFSLMAVDRGIFYKQNYIYYWQKF